MSALRNEGQAAHDRLRELDLDGGLLLQSLARADVHAAAATPFHPRGFEGTTRWHYTVHYVREGLAVQGWEFDDPSNQPRSIHPSGSFTLIVSSGDQYTGSPIGSPTTKNPKGATLIDAVKWNEQLTFNLGPEFQTVRHPLALSTWLLLYWFGPDVIKAEVSRPIAMNGAQISEWAERILLPDMPRNPSYDLGPITHDDDDGDASLYEVPVSRRT